MIALKIDFNIDFIVYFRDWIIDFIFMDSVRHDEPYTSRSIRWDSIRERF